MSARQMGQFCGANGTRSKVPQIEVGRRSSITLNVSFSGLFRSLFGHTFSDASVTFSSLICPNSFCRTPFSVRQRSGEGVVQRNGCPKRCFWRVCFFSAPLHGTVAVLLDGKENRQSPIAGVQRKRSTLAGYSVRPSGANVPRTNAKCAIRETNWGSTKVSQKRVFALRTPEIRS